MTVSYNGRTYSAGFEVSIVETIASTELNITSSNIASVNFESGKKYNLVLDSSLTDSEVTTLCAKLKNNEDIGDSTLDLSAMTVTSISAIDLGSANVTELILPETLSSLGSCENNTKIVTITYNGTNGLSVGGYAFAGCTSLKNFPWEHVSESSNIGNAMFQGCSALESATIPAYIEYIDCNVFENCSSLKEIHFLGTTPPGLQGGQFDGCHEDLIFYVPSEAARTAFLNDTREDAGGYGRQGFAMAAVNAYATTPENLADHVHVEGQ